MSDYQQTSGNIRSFLATKAQTWTDHTADMAAHYASLCDETNQRLRRCADYLARGMWPAAIHLADCQPNLAQTVGFLKFPERSAWADLCVTHGMPAPAVLEDECLDAIKAAQAQEKRIEPLLCRHRLLAIGKAPVRDRLEVARFLAAEDSQNPAWAMEVLALETMRLEELNKQVHAAVRDSDDSRIKLLDEEIEKSPWRQEVPPALAQALQKSRAAVQARRVMSELPAAAAQLASTYQTQGAGAEMSIQIKRWRDLVATPGITPPDDLQAQVKGILDAHAAAQRRKDDMEEVKPLQHLFTAPKPTTRRRHHPEVVGLFFGLVGIVLIAAAVAFYYFRYIRE